MSFGASVLCPAAWLEMPTTCTSLSTASCAASSGRLEQGPDVHVEADVGEGRRDHLRPAVVAVLAHLDHQHPRPPPLLLGERARRRPGSPRSPRRPRRRRHRPRPASSPPPGAARRPAPSRPRSRPRWRAPAPPPPPRRAGCRRSAAAASSAASAPSQAAASRVARMRASRATCASRTFTLSTSRMSRWSSLRQPVAVDPDDHLLAAVDRRLPPRRQLLDPELGHAPRPPPSSCPPSASTSSISAQAFSASSAVRLST